MSKMTFDEYLADFPDLSPGLMTPAERERAYKNYKRSGPAQTTRAAVGEKTREARAVAKAAGGAALTGTAKQKAWGEKIRAEKLQLMSPAQQAAVTKRTGLFTCAKFWIEHRDGDAAQLGADALRLQEILAEFEGGDSTTRQALADEYNHITARWGF